MQLEKTKLLFCLALSGLNVVVHLLVLRLRRRIVSRHGKLETMRKMTELLAMEGVGEESI